MIKAINIYIDIYKYISNELQNDEDFVCAYVKLKSYIITNVALSIFTHNKRHKFINYLDYLSKELKYDKEVVLAAVKCNEQNIKHASKLLQEDKDVAFASIKHNIPCLYFISKNDKDFVMTAINYNTCNIIFPSKNLQNYFELIIATFQESYKTTQIW